MSIDFDPVKVGPRRRRFDPVRIVILAIVAGLAHRDHEAVGIKPHARDAGPAGRVVVASARPRSR